MRSSNGSYKTAAYQEDLELCRRADQPWIAQSYSGLGIYHFLRGEWDEALEWVNKAVEAEPQGVFEGIDVSFLMLFEAYMGHQESALALFSERRHQLPEAGRVIGAGSSSLLCGAVEAMTVIRENEKAAALYPAVMKLIGLDNRILIQAFPWHLLETVAAIAATAGEDWQLAETHFETAMRQPAVYDDAGNVVERERPPNCTMLIFLGKVHLGQVEAQHLQVAHSGDMTVRHDDDELRQLLEDRVAGIAARIKPDVADSCANGDAPGAGL